MPKRSRILQIWLEPLEKHKMTPPSKRLPQIVLLATGLYGWLIRLVGPEEFLQEYEELMRLDFRQQCDEVYKQQGIWGVLCLCPPMLMKH